MKANVTIPSSVAQAAERLAKRLGVSLSDLYTAALNSYVTTHHEDITEALNQVYATEPSEIDTELIKVQVALLDGETW